METEIFGLFKPKLAPLGPFEFAAEVEIAKPAGEVYSLIDWADERHAKRVTGNKVEAVHGKPDHFRMIMPMMPESQFMMAVTDAEPHRKYAYDSLIKPQCGMFAHSHESYEIEDLDVGNCRVTLSLSVTFAEGLLMRDFAEEVAKMAASVQSTIQKLKLQAEHGAAVAKAIESNTLI